MQDLHISVFGMFLTQSHYKLPNARNQKQQVKRDNSIKLSTQAVAFEYCGEWIFSPFKAQRRERSRSYVTRVATPQRWKKTPPEYMKATAWVLIAPINAGCFFGSAPARMFPKDTMHHIPEQRFEQAMKEWLKPLALVTTITLVLFLLTLGVNMT